MRITRPGTSEGAKIIESGQNDVINLGIVNLTIGMNKEIVAGVLSVNWLDYAQEAGDEYPPIAPV